MSTNSPINRALTFFISGVVALVLAAGGVIYTVNNRTEDTQQQLTERCEAGNDLRAGLQKYFIKQRHLAEHPDLELVEQLHISPETLKRVTAKNVKELNYDINVLFAPADCTKGD